MKHTLALLAENYPGVMSHVLGLISRRGFNIESISASPTERQDITRISLVVEVSGEKELAQIICHLEKIVHILKVLDMTKEDPISREMALIKVRGNSDNRGDIANAVDIFRAKILDVHPDTMVIEITGEVKKVDAFCELMAKHGIVEIIRTGEIFLSRFSEPASCHIEE